MLTCRGVRAVRFDCERLRCVEVPLSFDEVKVKVSQVSRE
jgi:hypothetical protein